MDCIFCQIRDGKIPSTRVYEDLLTLAFMDINPVNDGHLLVIPKAHAETIFDMSAADVAAVSATAKKMAEAIRQALHPEGLNLYQANGAAASQVVPHFHLHLIPRWKGDGRGFDWKLVKGDPERISATADKIRAQVPPERT
ncbi:MAG: HIT family protein [Candidatus Methylomirabilales bacterium]